MSSLPWDRTIFAPGLPFRGQKGLGSVEELHAGNFCHHLHTLKATFPSTAAHEGQNVLVAEMHGEFIQVRLEGNRFGNGEIIRFGSAFFSETAEIILTTEGAKPNAAQVSGIGIINGPYIDVLLLRALNRRV